MGNDLIGQSGRGDACRTRLNGFAWTGIEIPVRYLGNDKDLDQSKRLWVIRPPIMVRTARPWSFQPRKGEFLLFEITLSSV